MHSLTLIFHFLLCSKNPRGRTLWQLIFLLLGEFSYGLFILNVAAAKYKLAGTRYFILGRNKKYRLSNFLIICKAVSVLGTATSRVVSLTGNCLYQ